MTSSQAPANLKKWARALADKERYEGVPMINRTNLLIHSLRVKALAQAVGIVIDERIDAQLEGLEPRDKISDFDHFLVVTGSDQHDVVELITGDYPSPTKRAMTTEERKKLEEQEDQAAVKICQGYFGFTKPEQIQRYVDLLKQLRKKDTVEAQIVNVADKWDALGEKLHEICCGNESFMPFLENSRQIFAEFEEYSIWKYIKSDPRFRFDQIPTDKDLENLPRMPKEKIKRSRRPEKATLEAVKDWSVCYRSWLEMSFVNFWRDPKNFIYPGWFPGLTQRLGLED